MSDLVLRATTGRVLGSRSSSRLRIDGFVPGTLYGSGIEPLSIAVPMREFTALVNRRRILGSILEVELEGKVVTTLVKDVQRDPVKRILLHVDLQRLSANQELTAEVYLIASEGLELVTTTLSLNGPASAIPASIELTKEMLVDGKITAASVVLPKGIVVLDADEVLAIEIGLEEAE